MDQRRDYEKGLAAFKDGLTGDALDQAGAAGLALSLEAVVDYPLNISNTAAG